MVLAIAAGCAPGQTAAPTPVTEAAPANTCPQFACSAYGQKGAAPTCIGNHCLVSQAGFPGLVYVVSMSEDAAYAPGQTFIVGVKYPTTSPEDVFANPTGSCRYPTCGHVPALGFVQEAYVVDSATQQALDWNLGHPGELTALPVEATYEPFYNGVDAASLGLPVSPIGAYVIEDTSVSHLPGPGNGPSLAFQANLQPGTYRATISPDAPFDAAFPPDVNTVTVAAGLQSAEDLLKYDTTTEDLNGPPANMVPTFDLSPLGKLVGWTAYLRDATTRQGISTVVTVGKNTTTVLLPTTTTRRPGMRSTTRSSSSRRPRGSPSPRTSRRRKVGNGTITLRCPRFRRR